MKPSQIVVGMPSYAAGWTLADPNTFGIGAPALGPSVATESLNSAGSAAYYDVSSISGHFCSFLFIKYKLLCRSWMHQKMLCLFDNVLRKLALAS